MPKVAYIFPGQGAQYVGMGEDFYRHLPAAKAIFERTDSTLGFTLTDLIFKGPLDELSKTINCQLAVFTVSTAIYFALQSKQLDLDVRYTAGLSLGEYSSLVAAGALEFTEALKLVQARAQYMEEAARQNPGGMVSVIGLGQEAVEEISRRTNVEVANLNCPGQIVVSGNCAALAQAKEAFIKAGAKAIPLKVGGAFHCSLMDSASEKLAQDLAKTQILPPKIPIISNVTAEEQSLPQEIRANLIRQVSARTRWEDSIRYISAKGVKIFLELGPGQILKGLLYKIDPDLKVFNIGTVEELEEFRREYLPCY